MTTNNITIHVRLSTEQSEELLCRKKEDTSYHELARTMMCRYLDLVEYGRASIYITEEEAMILIQSIDPTTINIATAGLLPYMIVRLILEKSPNAGIEMAEELARKLHNYNVAQRMAIMDCIEQYHALAQSGMSDRGKLIKIGLIRES